MNNPEQTGRLVWRYRSGRAAGRLVNAGMALLVLALFFVLLRPLLQGDASPTAKVVVIFFVLAGAGGLYGSIRLLTRPMTLLSIYEQGLAIHRGPRGYGSGFYFIPWQQIAGIEAGERHRVDDEGTVSIPTIALTLAPNAPPPPEHLTTPEDSTPGRVHIDILYGGHGRETLLERLRRSRQSAASG